MLVWTEAESGKKKLRIEKYVTEKCGQGLNQVMEFKFLSRDCQEKLPSINVNILFFFSEMQ